MDVGHRSIVEGWPEAFGVVGGAGKKQQPQVQDTIGNGTINFGIGRTSPHTQDTDAMNTPSAAGSSKDDELRSQLYRSLFPMPVPPPPPTRSGVSHSPASGGTSHDQRSGYDHLSHLPSGVSLLPFPATLPPPPPPPPLVDDSDLAAFLGSLPASTPPPTTGMHAAATLRHVQQIDRHAMTSQAKTHDWPMSMSISTSGSVSSLGQAEVGGGGGGGGSMSAASHQSSPLTGLSPHSGGGSLSSFPLPRSDSMLASSSSSSLVSRAPPIATGRQERRSQHEPYERPAVAAAGVGLGMVMGGGGSIISESPEQQTTGHDAGSEGTGGEDGKPFVACRKCRSRKIRCDGAKPICKNCIKKGCECNYDETIRRRGPDKEPGARSKRREARLAMAEKQEPASSRKASAEATQQQAVEWHQRRTSATALPPEYDVANAGALPDWLLHDQSAQHVFDIPISVDVPTLPPRVSIANPAVPIVTYEALQLPLNIAYERLPNAEYARSSDWTWMALMLHPTDRAEGLRLLYEEMRYFFNLNFLWFAWFNRSLFFARLHGTDPHLTLQPALVLAILALTTLLRSSELAPDCQERVNAIFFADQALAMIQQAFAAQSTDSTLAYAAFLLAAFETCPHPKHSTNRFCAAVKLMDSTIKAFCLLSIDADNPRTSIFVEGFVPSPEAGLASASRIAVRPPQRDSRKSDEDGGDEKVLQRWAPQPQWPVEWTTAETQKDESRRMAWTASSMAASANLWLHTVNAPLMRLHLGSLSEPLLLNEDPLAGKITLWALYNRAILLWHFAISTFESPLDDAQKRSIAAAIWAETETIESRLFDIAMDGGDLQKWQAQDYLVGLRMIVLKLYCPPTANPDDLLIPGVHMDRRTLFRHTAQQWLASQSQVAKVLKSSSSTGAQTGIAPSLKNRPFFVWFLARSLKIALDLHEAMPGLPQALQMAEGLVKVIEILVAAWPCATAHQRWQELAARYNRIMAAQFASRKGSFSA